MTPGCLNKLFVLVKSGITKSTTNMRDASAPERKFAAETFLAHSCVVLFY